MPEQILDEIVDRQTEVDYVAIVDASPNAKLHKIAESDSEYDGHEVPRDFVDDLIKALCSITKHGHRDFNEEPEHNEHYTWIWVPLEYGEYHALFVCRKSRAGAQFAMTINWATPRLRMYYVDEAKKINRPEHHKR